MFINDSDVYRTYERFLLMISLLLADAFAAFFTRQSTSDNIKNKLSRLPLALKDFIDKNFTSMEWVILLLISLLSGAKPSNDITGLSFILS